MKVIFLDIDGVIRNQSYTVCLSDIGVKKANKVLNPQKVALLDYIINETFCNVVISSTWRIGRSVNDFQDLFLYAGMENYHAIIDTTRLREDRNRGKEIDDWCNKKLPSKFVILDDNKLGKHYGNQFFQTNPDIGLTKEISDQIINYLND